MLKLESMEKKNIIIAGAGFGGVTTALKLAKKMKKLPGYELILVDCHNYQTYTPALYEIASVPREYIPSSVLKSSIVIPIEDIIKNKPITFIKDGVIGLNLPEKKIILKNSGAISYEYLVFALGSEMNYFDIPGLKEHSFPLKTFQDAVRLRNTIEDLVTKKAGVKIVVGGAGASGVELTAEFVNFVCAIMRAVTKRKVCDTRFLLVEAAPEILPGFKEWTVKKAKMRLKGLGIEIKTGTMITSVDNRELFFKDGKRETYDILIWTGGVKGSSSLQKTGLPLSNTGSVLVGETLLVQGIPDSIFAIGDNSTFVDPRTQRPLIWNVPAAEQEGRIAAKNIIRLLRKKPLKKFTPYKKYPYILAIGRKYAIADLVLFHFSGILGWYLKQIVELRYLLFILPPKKAFEHWTRALRVYIAND